MSLKKPWLTWWRGPSAPTRRGFLLSGDLLEGRDVPTVFAWDPLINYNWSQSGNWVKQNAEGGWESTFDVPGSVVGRPDTAEFLGDANKGCFVDVGVTVPQVMIKNGYTNIIQLSAPLTVSGTSGTGSGLLFSSGATILGNGGSLTIGGSAVFAWRGGTLQGLTTTIAQGARMVVPAPDTGDTARTMTSATLEVQGTLNWEGGNVTATTAAGQARSEVHVQLGGAFNISAAGGTWCGADRTQFAVVNRGR